MVRDSGKTLEGDLDPKIIFNVQVLKRSASNHVLNSFHTFFFLRQRQRQREDEN